MAALRFYFRSLPCSSLRRWQKTIPTVPCLGAHHARFYATEPNRGGEDTVQSYRYSPLRQALINQHAGGAPTFRLLELLPGAPLSPIKCQLKELEMDGPDEYEAVSYCWGDPADRESIICNGKQLRIPSSLAQGLEALRYKDRVRLLWADAICIDQTDPNDKATQVPMMRDIYSRSQRTLIWLGLKDKGAPGISLLAALAVHICVPLLALVDKRTHTRIRTLDIRTGIARELKPLSGKFYLAMAQILRRPWFRRAWVVQEAAVSRKATIIFDYIEYEWDDLVRSLRYMLEAKFPTAFLGSPQHIAAIDHERKQYAAGGSGLPAVLVRHQRCLATDERDKVFAFAGLIDPASAARDVRVTYIDSAATVYQELATRIIQRDQNLDILSRPPTREHLKLAGLPSWVPDWSVGTDVDTGYIWRPGLSSLAGTEARDGDQQESRFSASRQTNSVPEITENALTAMGYSIDTVTRVGPMFEGVVLPEKITSVRAISQGWMHTWRTFLKSRSIIIRWQEMMSAYSDSNARYALTGEPLKDVFWETVCAGQYSTSKTAHEAAVFWDRTTRRSRFRPKTISPTLDPLGIFFSSFVLFASLFKNEPLFEFKLQGRYILNRRMVVTSKGYIGLAGCATDVGDHIFLCQGSSVPLVLRKHEDGKAWGFLGDAYVHGIMNGEIYEDARCEKVVMT